MSSKERHEWLEEAAAWCSRALERGGYTVPAKTRVSIGFAGKGRKVLGVCFASAASSDEHAEIFIGPHIKDPVEIVGVILHELIHAAVGHEAKHGPIFRKAALLVGLEGKMTATVVGEKLRETIETKLLAYRPYPAGTIDLGLSGVKTQTTRLLKCECGQCGYTARVTRKWVDISPPLCPICEDSPALNVV